MELLNNNILFKYVLVTFTGLISLRNCYIILTFIILDFILKSLCYSFFRNTLLAGYAPASSVSTCSVSIVSKSTLKLGGT